MSKPSPTIYMYKLPKNYKTITFWGKKHMVIEKPLYVSHHAACKLQTLQMCFSTAKREKETGAKSPCVEQKRPEQIMCLQNLISFTIQFNCFINHRTVPSRAIGQKFIQNSFP